MTDVIVVPQTTEWQRLKALVNRSFLSIVVALANFGSPPPAWGRLKCHQDLCCRRFKTAAISPVLMLGRASLLIEFRGRDCQLIATLSARSAGVRVVDARWRLVSWRIDSTRGKVYRCNQGYRYQVRPHRAK